MNVDRRALAEAWDELEDSGHEFDGLVPVNARISKNPRAVVSIRMGEDELDEIENAAAGNVSDFIRTAALEKARMIAGGLDKALADPRVVAMLSDKVARARQLANQLSHELADQPSSQASVPSGRRKRITKSA